MISTIKSAFLRLAGNDFVKAGIVAVLTPVAAVVGRALDAFGTGQAFVLNYSSLWHLALSAAAGYIIKQLLTNSQGQFLKAEPPKIVSIV